MALAVSCPTASGATATVYTSAFVGSGGTPPYTYAITVGALPTGLTLTAGTGAVTGTPTVAGTFNFTGRVTDALAATATHACSIVITASATYPLRRVRRFALPYAQNIRVFLQRLQMFLQVGMASSPPIYLRFSKDGGQTWGDYVVLDAGASANYTKRVFVNVNSSARNWVAEFVVDFPSQWYLVDAFADIEVGTY